MKKIVLSLLLSAFFISAQASPPSALEDLKSKIKHVQTYLNNQQSKRDSYELQLKESELKSSELARELQKTSLDLAQKKEDLKKLELHTREYQNEFGQHQQLLAQQLRAGYPLLQESYLKLLLSQQDPQSISRNLRYYHYIQQNRLETMNTLKTLLAKIKANQIEIKMQNQQLINLKVQQQQEKLKLSLIQQERKQAILSLTQDIKTKNQKLQALMANKHRLENTLTHLNQHKPQFVTTGKSFASLKGHLSWPTHGQIIQAYGSSIEQSELRATGVLIAAPLFQSVRAIAPGKVIFAKWMTGYGLLLIIDHGNHYLSLYGRNHSLAKQEGEIVKAGEEIATVGDSGGYQKSALYFALRHNADSLNPAAWMAGKP